MVMPCMEVNCQFATLYGVGGGGGGGGMRTSAKCVIFKLNIFLISIV